MLEARACVFYLLDTTTRRLRCAASSAAPELQVPEGEFDLEGCLFASPVHTRRQIWFQNLCSPEFLEMPDMPRGAGLGSVLSTPVVFENDVLGVLAVFSAGTHRFDNDEKRLCAALAGLAGGKGTLLSHDETAWASITFSGTRHCVVMEFCGIDAVACGEDLIERLPDHEFAIPGQLVADATVVLVQHNALPEPCLEVEVQLLLLEDA